MTETTLTYETACARIEAIIRRLDSGEAGLRETLELCQEGRQLVEFCAGELEAVGRGLEELKLDELVARLEAGPGAAIRGSAAIARARRERHPAERDPPQPARRTAEASQREQDRRRARTTGGRAALSVRARRSPDVSAVVGLDEAGAQREQRDLRALVLRAGMSCRPNERPRWSSSVVTTSSAIPVAAAISASVAGVMPSPSPISGRQARAGCAAAARRTSARSPSSPGASVTPSPFAPGIAEGDRRLPDRGRGRRPSAAGGRGSAAR